MYVFSYLYISLVIERLTRMADGYFDAIAGINCAAPVEEFASDLTQACASVGGGDHLRLTVKPVNLSVREKAGSKSNLICRTFDATLGSLDVFECLYEEKVYTIRRALMFLSLLFLAYHPYHS